MSKGGGHFIGNTYDNSLRNEDVSLCERINIEYYKKLKCFCKTYYPDTEIISVNPIGLKGMFKDVYTKSYLDTNPKIKEKLGNNIEILEK